MNAMIPLHRDAATKSTDLDFATVRKPVPVRTFDSRDLFAGSREIAIDHDGALYRLKITRQGKLILNK